MRETKQHFKLFATVVLIFSFIGVLSGCSSSKKDPDEGTDSTTGTTDSTDATDGTDGADGTDGNTGTDGTDGGTDATDGGTGGGDPVNVVVTLSGAEEVPPVSAEGATGEANLVFDPASNTLTGTVSASGLSGDATGAHLHQGFAGINGGIAVALEVADTANAFNVPADTVLSDEQVTALLRGEMYVNVHTDANANGELRGQIAPPGVTIVRTSLSGDQQTPPVATTASGEGVVTLHEASYGLWATVILTNLDNATATHIHEGAAGSEGGIAVPLAVDPGNVAIWRTEGNTSITPEQFAAAVAGNMYFNVHTDANPNGEIRGQVTP